MPYRGMHPYSQFYKLDMRYASRWGYVASDVHDCDDDCSVIRIGPTSVSVTANCRMTGRSGQARFLALKG